jgi:hypothetical protein
MACAQRNNVVQQVSSAAFDPTLRYTVLPGTPERGLHRAHLQKSNCRWKLPSIFRISTEDHKLGSGTKWKRLPQLLDDPTTRRMLGDVNVQDAPPIMADDEEAGSKITALAVDWGEQDSVVRSDSLSFGAGGASL